MMMMRTVMTVASGLVLGLAFAGLPALAGEDKPTEFGKLAAEMKPGEWKELKTTGYTKELLTSGGGGIIAYSESMAWDNYRKEEKGFWALDPAEEKAEWRKLPDPPAAEGAVATISTYGVIMLLNYQRIMVYKHAPAEKKTN